MIIREGWHYCLTWMRLLPFARERKGKLMLPLSNWYGKGFVKNSGWNKLTGVGQIFGVHTNSGRLVYQPLFDKLGMFTIGGYVYSKGVRTDTIFANIKADEWYNYEVSYVAGQWLFTINGVTIRMNGKEPFLKTKLFPYFGGKDKAYYKMKYYFK